MACLGTHICKWVTWGKWAFFTFSQGLLPDKLTHVDTKSFSFSFQ